MRPSPERPCDDVSGLDAPLCQPHGIRRISWTDQRISARAVSAAPVFLGRRVGVMADHRQQGKRHITKLTCRCTVPGTGLVVSEPEFGLGVSNASSIAQRWPSTAARVAIDDAGPGTMS